MKNTILTINGEEVSISPVNKTTARRLSSLNKKRELFLGMLSKGQRNRFVFQDRIRKDGEGVMIKESVVVGIVT